VFEPGELAGLYFSKKLPGTLSFRKNLRMKNHIGIPIAIIASCLLWLAILLTTSGCTRTVYVPKESVKIEYRDRVRIDSVVTRDSVAVLKTGDTIYITRDRWRDKYHLLRDTVSRVDSIPYPVEVVRQVKHIPALYRWSLWITIATLLYAGWSVKRKLF
jgi:hypothetical protein